MAKAHTFNQTYFERYYRNPKTRVVTRKSIDKLATFVASYLKHIHMPVRRVLDMGCGLGLWQQSLQQHFPRASSGFAVGHGAG